MTDNDTFSHFLKNIPNYNPSLLGKFEQYKNLILEYNTRINLISRHTEESIWTTHFLDSILPYDLMDFHNKTLLDFGSGGGLPGIPIKIIYPDISLYLLEAKRKKSFCLKKMVEGLGLTDSYVVNKRLEEVVPQYKNFFDIIVSRAVRIDKDTLLNLLLILKEDGKIMLYKGEDFQSELIAFSIKERKVKYQIIYKRFTILGKRNYVLFEKK